MSPQRTARARARIAAFELVEAVQSRDTGDAVETALAEAEAAGWSEVVRVLLYAAVVRAFGDESPDLLDRISVLQQRAEADRDPSLAVTALASRAEAHFASGSEHLRYRSDSDLAAATAQLPHLEGPALEQATAYVACAVAYSARDLWEIEAELYAQAAPMLADCEVPLLEAVVVFNRAETSVRLMCALAEMDDKDELSRTATRARDALRAAGHTPVIPAEWAREVAIFEHLVAALTDTASLHRIRDLQRIAAAATTRAGPLRGMVRLAAALRARSRRDWAEVIRQAEVAAALSGDDAGASGRALALRLAACAEAELAGERTGGSTETSHALDWAEFAARRRWQSRLRLVGLARASLQTEQLRLERDRHATAALVDELTGLANRRGYSRHLQDLRDLPAPGGLAVLLVDLDDFKAVNDTYGHAVGDAALAQVADTLRAATRSRDLVARLGGDEFVVLLAELGTAAAVGRATDLQRRLGAVDWTGIGLRTPLTVSIGVAAEASPQDPESLVRRADAALYAAKARGGGQVESDRPPAY